MQQPDVRLRGRVALVTGAASGIGAGIAEGFARAGADLAMVDQVSETDAATLLAAARRHGTRVTFHAADVADDAQVAAATSGAVADHGRVDVLVNNAGVFTQSLVADMTVQEWDRVLAVNLRGTFLCSRALLAPMVERGWGRVINVASQLGKIGGVEAAHYSASKGAVIAFTKSLAREVARSGVLVNAIAPGPIRTPLLDGETEQWRSAKLAELPIGRFGEVAEVVPTALLLASEDGSYYVGQTLGPNGGDVML